MNDFGENDKLFRELSKEHFLCKTHIQDYAIEAFVKESGNHGKCSYCGKKRIVTSFIEVAKFIKKGILRFYDNVNNEGLPYDDEDQEYRGANYDTEDLLNYEVGLKVDNDILIRDLVDYLDHATWCEKDPYGDREDEELNYNWAEFKNVVKHKSRYVFLGSKQFKSAIHGASVDSILFEIGGLARKLKLFSIMEVGTPLFRCRQHTDKEDPPKLIQDFSSPPDEEAIFPNRMSPAGVSMFYAAFDAETAYNETLDLTSPKKNIISTGVFRNKEKLLVLNLAELPRMPSIFDEKESNNYYSMLFLKNFANDLSADIDKDGRQHIEYVPTQIITEYFRFTYGDLTNMVVDGIIYPSSKNRKHKACVLFYNQIQCVEKLEFFENLINRKPIPRLTII